MDRTAHLYRIQKMLTVPLWGFFVFFLVMYLMKRWTSSALETQNRLQSPRNPHLIQKTPLWQTRGTSHPFPSVYVMLILNWWKRSLPARFIKEHLHTCSYIKRSKQQHTAHYYISEEILLIKTLHIRLGENVTSLCGFIHGVAIGTGWVGLISETDDPLWQ